MTHIRQKLALTPVRQLGRFPSSRVLLDTRHKVTLSATRSHPEMDKGAASPIPQIEDHVIDLSLQTIHLPTSLDRNEPREIAIHSRR